MTSKITNVRILELVRLLMRMSNSGAVFVDLEMVNTPEKPNRLVVHPVDAQKSLPAPHPNGPLTSDIIHQSI
jgi:hypothetical protein